uniref:Uncharacterized protein n=1 Tax=Cucumis melo TaxID=3656 RepID=A0A9I9CGH2_CUCME
MKGFPERDVGVVEEEEVAGVEEHGGDRGGERRSGADEEARVVGESEKAGSGNGFVWISRTNKGVGLDMDDEEVVKGSMGIGISDGGSEKVV